MRVNDAPKCRECNRILPWSRDFVCDECARKLAAKPEQSLAAPGAVQIGDTLHVTALRVTEHPVVLTDAQRLAVVTEIRELWEQMLGDPLHVVLDAYQRAIVKRKEEEGHG